MVVTEDVKERFQGRELWHTINMSIIFVTYSIMFVVLLVLPKLLGWFFLGIAIAGPTYFAISQRFIYDIQLKLKGSKIIGGWVEHSHGQGERFTPIIKEIHPIDRLSDDDIIAVDEFIKFITAKGAEKILPKIGNVKTLTYKEQIDLDEAELKEFKQEYIGYKKSKENIKPNET
ncbi:hypothetical protein LCGC14_0664740 [marine sediment metagenome]|uniref:Uncharacterized protein n=1 Tax=marine sediment metagenome TaxID=412755 RepID=A0A0F9U0R8_9ZZZZ